MKHEECQKCVRKMWALYEEEVSVFARANAPPNTLASSIWGEEAALQAVEKSDDP